MAHLRRLHVVRNMHAVRAAALAALVSAVACSSGISQMILQAPLWVAVSTPSLHSYSVGGSEYSLSPLILCGWQ
jgi:hypothetical protein